MSAAFQVHTWQSPRGEVLRYGIISAGGLVTRPPIVYIPGLGGSIKSAIGFLSRFAEAGHPVFSLDAQGWGLNDHLPCYPNPKHYLAHFEDFTRYLAEQGHLGDSPVLMGLSLGGVLASLAVQTQPHPFEKVILLAPAFKPHPKTFSLGYRLKAYGSVITQGLGGKLQMPYGVRELTQNPEARQDPHLQKPLSVPLVYMLVVDQLCQQAFKGLAQIAQPVALVIPEADVVCCPQTMAQAFERLKHPQNAMWVQPQLYHDIPREPEPYLDAVFETLQNWMTIKTPCL